MISIGVQKGDRVGVWSPNCAEWLIAQYALAKVGAIMVNINPAYRLWELEHALTQSGVSVIVAARGFRNSNYAAMINELAPRLAALKQTIYLGKDRQGSAITWDDLLENGKAVPGAVLCEREASLQCDDPINIQYTSGTTGRPNGATLSHHNILNNGLFIGEQLQYTPADRICLPVPFYHCFGCVLGSLAALTHGSLLFFLRNHSMPKRAWRRFKKNAAPRSTVCRPCSSPNSIIRHFPLTGSIRSGRESWPERHVPLRSCGRSLKKCTCARSPSRTV
jgi:fatty-acyl-CoA synthase